MQGNMRINQITVQDFQNEKARRKMPAFCAALIEPLDKAYKIALQKGLYDKFQLACRLEDLNGVAGPVEFKKLLKLFTPRNFEVGLKKYNNFDEEIKYKYAIDGTFRCNFHSHSNVSDGTLMPKDFLEMCTTYADKVAKKLGKPDKIPPFSAALTDHDRYLGSILIIKEIVKNPAKYKNFKFVVGSEFLFRPEKEGEQYF